MISRTDQVRSIVPNLPDCTMHPPTPNASTLSTLSCAVRSCLSFGKLALGHIHLIAVQLIHVCHHFRALDGQQYEAGYDVCGQGTAASQHREIVHECRKEVRMRLRVM